MEYIKDFNTWSELKQKLDQIELPAFVHPREIWWCSLGVNIGAEIDGKNENFERPVLTLKVYNKETVLILPIVSKADDEIFHYKVISTEKPHQIRLTQSRTISTKRLLRKIDIVAEEEFENLKKVWKDSI